MRRSVAKRLNSGLRRGAFGALSALPPGTLSWIARWFIRDERRRWVHTLVSRLVRSSEVTVAHGPSAGLRLAANGSSAGYLLGITEPAVQEAIARHLQHGMSFYDVGANVGFFTVLAARSVGPAGHVYAFEPSPSTAAVLRRNVSLNAFANVTVLESAVSNRTQRGHLSGGDPVLAQLLDNRASGSVEVEVVTIDELVTTGRLKPPDLVKVDVEGREPDVIDGMRATLHRFRPAVIYEVHSAESGARTWALLTNVGYEIALLSDPPGAMRHCLATPCRASGMAA